MPPNAFDNLNTNTPEGRRNARNQMLYDDPKSAMRNAMLDAGFNPYTQNPFIKMLLGSGNGLYAAAMLNGMDQGTTVDDITARGGTGTVMRQYMENALRNGGVFSSLAGASSGLSSIGDRLTDYSHKLTNGEINADKINPFIGSLMNQMSSPEGLQGLMSALNGPMLGRQLGSSYQGMLGDILSSQERRMAGDDDTYTPGKARDFWEYAFKRFAPGTNPRFVVKPSNPSGSAPSANGTGPVAGPQTSTPAQNEIGPSGPPIGPPAPGQPGNADAGVGTFGPPAPGQPGNDPITPIFGPKAPVDYPSEVTGKYTDSLGRLFGDIVMQLPGVQKTGATIGNVMQYLSGPNAVQRLIHLLSGAPMEIPRT